MSDEMDEGVPQAKDGAICRLAQDGGAVCDRVEHRLHVGRRTRDHPQDFRGSRLLLQRLLEIARLRLHLVEQTRVLDRDYRLIGEGLDEFDLAQTEGTGLRLGDDENAFDPIVAEQRHSEQRPRSVEFIRGVRVVLVLKDVRNDDDLACQHDPPRSRTQSRLRRISDEKVGESLGDAEMSADPKSLAVANVDRAMRGADQIDGRRDQGIEDRLQIEGGTFSTSAVAVCCRNDSSRSRVRACTSSNRRAFSIAMTAWSAKV